MGDEESYRKKRICFYRRIGRAAISAKISIRRSIRNAISTDYTTGA